MKLSNLFWNLLGIMVLSACSNSDMTENDLSETNVDARFMSVDITNTTGFRTRAAGDQSGDLYEEGESVENDVESVRFYFSRRMVVLVQLKATVRITMTVKRTKLSLPDRICLILRKVECGNCYQYQGGRQLRPT